MNPDEHELERLIDEKLKQLPTTHAPRTLMPRVLAEVRRRAALPWYQRAWFTWPRPWQAVSVVAMAAALIGLSWLIPQWNVAELLRGSVARIGETADGLDSWLNTAALLWRTLVQPALLWLLAIVGCLTVACAALGTAALRLLGKELKLA